MCHCINRSMCPVSICEIPGDPPHTVVPHCLLVNLSAPVVVQTQSHINSLSQPIYQSRFTKPDVLLM